MLLQLATAGVLSAGLELLLKNPQLSQLATAGSLSAELALVLKEPPPMPPSGILDVGLSSHFSNLSNLFLASHG